MAQITLSFTEVKRLIKFCEDKALTTYFIAKDSGAYLGASKGAKPEDQCIFYFRGCDPKKDAAWYENARDKFGGDDFGETFDIAALRAMLAKVEAWEAEMQAAGKRYKAPNGVQWNVTKTRIAYKVV